MACKDGKKCMVFTLGLELHRLMQVHNKVYGSEQWFWDTTIKVQSHMSRKLAWGITIVVLFTRCIWTQLIPNKNYTNMWGQVFILQCVLKILYYCKGLWFVQYLINLQTIATLEWMMYVVAGCELAINTPKIILYFK